MAGLAALSVFAAFEYRVLHRPISPNALDTHTWFGPLGIITHPPTAIAAQIIPRKKTR